VSLARRADDVPPSLERSPLLALVHGERAVIPTLLALARTDLA